VSQPAFFARGSADQSALIDLDQARSHDAPKTILINASFAFAGQDASSLFQRPDLQLIASDACRRLSSRSATMAETTKLSVEKALEKLRRSDSPKSKNTRLDEEVDALNEDIKRMRAQRQRLEQHRRKRD
jgi:hypothetical protein